jgi:hypothetical protein
MEAPTNVTPSNQRLQEYQRLSEQETHPSQIRLRTGEGDLLDWLVGKIKQVMKDTKTEADPKVFRHYYKRIKRLSVITGQIKNEELRNKISIFAIHYLLKGAKIPLRQSTQNTFSLPFLDFNEIVNPTYYRSDASSINRVYDSLLKTRGYEFIFDTKYSFGFIKSEKFLRLLAGHFEFEKMKKKFGSDYDDNLKILELKIQELQKSPQKVLDITPLFNAPGNTPLAPIELEKRLNQINELISKNWSKNERPRICGFIKFPDGQTGMITLGGDELFKQIVFKIRKKGYRPDLPVLEKSLVNQGFSEHLLSQSLAQTEISKVKPSTKVRGVEVYSIDNVLYTLEHLITKISEIADKPQAADIPLQTAYHYYEFLHSLFSTISTYGSLAQDEVSKQIVSQSLGIITEKLRSHDKKNISFDKFLKDIDLIAEELILQLCFVKTPPLKETITHLVNTKIPVEGLNNPPKAHVYTSGMNAFSQLISAMYRAKDRQGQKMEVGVVENIYFEVQTTFLAYLQRIAIKSEITLNTPAQRLPELIFSDLYTNNAPIPKVAELDYSVMFPCKKIQNASVKQQNAPITLVIDTSTSMFYDSKVQEIVNYYKDLINDGTLNLVFINSLAKFSMCGLDKYQGAAIIVYNNGSERFKGFNEHLERYESREPISPEANAFFNIFMTTGDEVLKYKELINANTTYVYDELIATKPSMTAFDKGDIDREFAELDETKRHLPKGLFLVKRTSDRIPSIAIHFGAFTEPLWRKYKQLKAEGIEAEAVKTAKVGRKAKRVKKKKQAAAKQAASQLTEGQLKTKRRRERKEMESDLPHLKEQICVFFKEYIATKADRAGLPLYPRQSFGFAHSAISDNGSALRLTIGLENHHTLDQYVKLIHHLNLELEKLTDDEGALGKLAEILNNPATKLELENFIRGNPDMSFAELIGNYYPLMQKQSTTSAPK